MHEKINGNITPTLIFIIVNLFLPTQDLNTKPRIDTIKSEKEIRRNKIENDMENVET